MVVQMSAPGHEPAPVRVVLCDDVEPLRKLSRFVLEEHGEVEVVGEAGDAQCAIDLAREQQPDAVLLDLSLPGMDGLQAIPYLKDAAPDVVVIVFSGFAAERMEAAALAQGAARYLEKGTDLVQVRDAVVEATRTFA